MYLVFASVFALVGIDQILKYLAIQKLQPVGSIPLWEDVFHFTYVENYGAAGGILAGRKIFLIVLTSAVILFLIWFLFKKKVPGKLLPWMVGLVIAGGIGNLIDRIFRGYVVDYLDFCLIRFPVFNFADCCVVIGVSVIAIFILCEEWLKKRRQLPSPKKAEE